MMKPQYAYEIMTPSVVELRDSDSVQRAIEIFDETRIGGAPVRGEDGAYVGFLSKTDIVTRRLCELLAGRSLDKIQVKELMGPQLPFAVPEMAPVETVVQEMMKYSVHRIFVEDAEMRLIGVISALDVVRMLSQSGASGSASHL